MFEKRYIAVLADTEESKTIHYELRHQIYCVEKGFEEKAQSSVSSAQEKDSFDAHSVHFLVRDLLKSKWVGTLRVVLPKQGDLPMLQVVGDDLFNNNDLPIAKVAEISRLSVLNKHRHATASINEHSFSEVMFSLVGAAKQYCESLGITTWVFLCRKSLSKIAHRQGMAMDTMGGPYEYKGVRYPYKVSLQNAFNNLEKTSQKLHEILQTEQAYQCYSEYYA